MAHQELKLEIRDVGPMIIARLADEECPAGVLIATLNINVANAHPQAFEKFKAFATDIVKLMLEDAGAEVHGFMEQPVDAGAAGHA